MADIGYAIQGILSVEKGSSRRSLQKVNLSQGNYSNQLRKTFTFQSNADRT